MENLSHLKTGFFKAKCIFVNPTKEELESIFEEELDKDPVYCWEKEGVKKCVIDFYLKSVYNDIFKYSIYLEDTDDISQTGKYKYINCTGQTQYVESEDQLWDSMKNFESVISWKLSNGTISEKFQAGARPHEKEIIGSKKPRIAKKGEDSLLHISKVIQEANIYNSETFLYFNLNDLFSGDYSKVRKIINNSEYNVTAFAYVSFDLKQKIWSEFMPVNIIRDINNNMTFNTYTNKIYNEWLKNSQGEYGIKGHYVLDKLQPFKPEFIKGKREFAADSDEY